VTLIIEYEIPVANAYDLTGIEIQRLLQTAQKLRAEAIENIIIGTNGEIFMKRYMARERRIGEKSP